MSKMNSFVISWVELLQIVLYSIQHFLHISVYIMH